MNGKENCSQFKILTPLDKNWQSIEPAIIKNGYKELYNCKARPLITNPGPGNKNTHRVKCLEV